MSTFIPVVLLALITVLLGVCIAEYQGSHRSFSADQLMQHQQQLPRMLLHACRGEDLSF